MEKLDDFTLNIEFLLISVVQGVALAALATQAAVTIGDLSWMYFPYVIASFLIILSFWSEAIIHAISFIDWPLDLLHSFMYFLASFIEVMAFTHVENPLAWFGFMSGFFIVAVGSYYVDLKMIRDRKNKFKTKEEVALYGHILNRQRYQIRFILPSATIFCISSFFAILFNENLFITHHWNLLLISIQMIMGFVILGESMKNFSKRTKLVAAARGK
ncbi:MAG TPA: hypothetical protein VHE53_01630 [Patescibacteria group bacterium]|nr:hypothetical protein [Patescibacteria group bacterium]